MEYSEKKKLKSDWRQTLKGRLEALSLAQYARSSELICQRIYQSASWNYLQTLALFASLPKEPQLQSLAELAWVEKKTVLFPRVNPDGQTLTFYPVQKWTDLQPGTWGIPEPASHLTPHPQEILIDQILVPGLGFDRRGARLGRGKGFYDRFLATLPQETIKLGVFFSQQELKEVPETGLDCRLDGIVTERELFLL